ncbi:MAG: histidine phosphatase family protein [Jiangellaceae bacterium]
MPTVLLVRHGRTGANSAAVLAGRSPGTHLDEVGREQARSLARRLAGVTLAAVVSSPLERCHETATALTGDRGRPAVEVDNRLTECDYGDWTGRRLATLAREKLWKVVQTHPSGATFPGGESLRAVQARAVEAVRSHDALAAAAAGPNAVWVAVSHGDVIKAVVADALGLHLDLFQRLVIDPGSVTIVQYTDLRPFVVGLNDTGGDLSRLRRRVRSGRRPSSDAMVGGAAGTT